MTDVRWTGTDQIKNNMTAYGEKARQAVYELAQFFAPILETYAKQNAGWTDRTANARQSLYAVATKLAEDAVSLRLSHGVNYGVFLEVRWQGKYAIIWPTLQAHFEEIRQALQRIFG